MDHHVCRVAAACDIHFNFSVFTSPSCAAVPPCHPCCDCTLRLECASACQHLFPHGDRCEARYLPGFHQGGEFAQPLPWLLMANQRGLVLGIGALGNNSVPCSVVETGRARFSSYGTLITSSVCLGARLCSAAAILRGMRCASLAASKTVGLGIQYSPPATLAQNPQRCNAAAFTDVTDL